MRIHRTGLGDRRDLRGERDRRDRGPARRVDGLPKIHGTSELGQVQARSVGQELNRFFAQRGNGYRPRQAVFDTSGFDFVRT